MTTRFVIETAIGEGGFGKVRKGRDSTLARDVAIKTLDPLWAKADDKDKERFRREARTLASLSHPNIPAIYDVEFTETAFHIIFQYIAGASMRELMRQSKALALSDTRVWFDQVASALGHAHDAGVIHRDVKPENMVVTEDQRHCYLVDFGIAISKADRSRLTTEHGVIGTPGYMSPEHENGEDVDASDDIYVLGVCLYEALAGHRIAAGAYEELTAKNEAIPPAIDGLISECIAAKGRRVKSAADFRKRLTAAFRIGAPLSAILSEGQLYQIAAAIREMSAEDFMALPAGQRSLIIVRAKDLLEAGEHMQAARTEFLSVLPALAMYIDPDEYREIVDAALVHGFEYQADPRWIGNTHIRASLDEAAKRVGSSNHHVLVEALLYWVDKQDIENRGAWFYHALRNLISRMMANTACADSDAATLSNLLKQVNRLQRAIGA